MGDKQLQAFASCAILLVLVACSGSGAVPPRATSGPVTFNSIPGLVCCPSPDSISVQPNGLATETINGSAVATEQLSVALTSQIFDDVQRAWPLNRLPPGPEIPDTGILTVTWDGETSPNIAAASSGVEAALNTDAGNVALAFPPQ